MEDETIHVADSLSFILAHKNSNRTLQSEMAQILSHPLQRDYILDRIKSSAVAFRRCSTDSA